MEKVHDGGAYVLKELDGSELKIAVAGNRLKRYWSKVANERTNGDNVLNDDDVSDDNELPATQNSDQPANKEGQSYEYIGTDPRSCRNVGSPCDEDWPLPEKGFCVRI